jgi:hypothetical protein
LIVMQLSIVAICMRVKSVQERFKGSQDRESLYGINTVEITVSVVGVFPVHRVITSMRGEGNQAKKQYKLLICRKL